MEFMLWMEQEMLIVKLKLFLSLERVESGSYDRQLCLRTSHAQCTIYRILEGAIVRSH